MRVAVNDPPDGTASSYEKLERQIVRNTGWVALGLAGSQAASLLSMLVLARLLDPKAFGLVALSWTVLYYIGQIQESGLGAAFIYRRDDVAEAAGTALVYTVLAGILLYGIGFGVSPLAASFFHADELTAVLRVMALVLVFRSLGVIPGAILERSLDFRSKTVVDLSGTLAQVVAFIGLAVAGFGVWSLVVGNVVAAAVQAAVVWLRVPWRPSPRLASRRMLLELVRYGRFVTATNLLNVVGNTIDNLAVGRLLGTAAVGYYAVAFRLANFPNSVLGYVVGRPMFAAYSRLQGDLAGVRQAYVRNLERIALFALPASIAVTIAAEPIVLALLGEKWRAAVTPLRILGIYGLVKPFGGPTAEALKGIGKPHVPLIFSLAYAITVIPALFVLTPAYGLKGAALSMLIAMAVTVPPAMAVYMRAVGLRARDVARSLAPPVLCSAVLAVSLGVIVSESSSMSPVASLALIVPAGVCVYVASTALFARRAVAPLWLAWRGGSQ